MDFQIDYPAVKARARQFAADFIGAFGIYILWISLHYVAPHLYVYYCTPASFQGFLLSPLVAPAPHCYGLRWIIYNGGNSIAAMWLLVGAWFLRKLVPVGKPAAALVADS